MTVKEAREILQRPIFGDPLSIQARDVVSLSEEVAKLPRSVPLKVEEMDEVELRYEMECTEFRARVRSKR